MSTNVQHVCSALQDDLIERLGGVDKVAEMSGRNKRMVAGSDGRYRHLSRATDVPLDMVRLIRADTVLDG